MSYADKDYWEILKLWLHTGGTSIHFVTYIFWLPYQHSYILWQRTVKEGTESKQCMVASKWASWGSEPVVHVHSSSSYVHSGNNSAYCSHIFVLQNAYYLSNLQSLCNCLERRKLSAGSDAQTIHSKREEEIRNSARQARWSWKHDCRGNSYFIGLSTVHSPRQQRGLLW